MGGSWFDEYRYGMFVHSNIATVPAFAPVHEYADWYWAFIDPKPDVVLHPTCPMPEVVTWHQEHYGDQPFDVFIPQLTMEAFDADHYADVLDAAGMRYAVHVTKHHDGFCFWDASHTDRNSVRQGPHRDVAAELAGAIRRRGHVFGAYYSLLDWSHAGYPDQQRYVDAFMWPQMRELVERFQPAVLWGDGHWGFPGAHWRSDAMLDELRALAQRDGYELLVNDRFWASQPDFATYEYDVPHQSPGTRWELCRGLGYSFCFNRAERDEDHLTPAQVVAMLVETVAKGGNLLLNVGPRADGTLPEIQERILRESGEWVRAHADAIHGSTPFVRPGSGWHWYTRTGDRLNAFDLLSSPEPRFASVGAVASVRAAGGAALPFVQDGDAVRIDARAVARHPFGACYHVTLHEEARAAPVRLEPPGPVSRDGLGYGSITDALAGAGPGSVVDLGPGRFGTSTETFPLVVGPGVTLRAKPGTPANRIVIDAGGVMAVQLGSGATLHSVTVQGGAPGYMMLPATCVSGAGDGIVVSACVLESVLLSGGAGHVVSDNVIAGGKVWLMGTTGCTVRANFQHGLRWGVGIEVNGGAGHVITDNECRDDLCAIRCVETDDVEIVRNRYETRWFGIHVWNARGTRVVRNRAYRTMRAVGIEGGSGSVVDKQLAEHCDTGVVVERGAQHTTISDSWFHDCRVGVLAWDAGDIALIGTAISEPREHAVVGIVTVT